MSIYADIDLLIIKLMASVVHEAAYRLLSRKFENKIQAMGVPEHELFSLGSGRFERRNSSKKADEAYKPLSTRGLIGDWPMMVIGSGLSESLNQLRTDARWWLIELGGQVKIVLLLSVKPALSVIHIEKWELGLAQRPMARAVASNAHQPPQVPTCVQAIDVDHNTVSGAPLL